ncbi:hypothetical protein N7456_006969 [Penicillium angulare]|uniref:Uncharacterized protein n=1 Tax=Penicillium angulare TaxID=116970 RepID=A0A9W9FIC3_9EURO|nr:hypothetical protein N7456_006830 [Penicillium angulare]KAJ5100917.1 hypothetical protein N7456_006969 [Penicillium angulare]
MAKLSSMLECLFGTLAVEPASSTSPRSPESVTSSIVTKILNAEDLDLLHKQLEEEVSSGGWTEAIAKATLHGFENAIKAGTEMARAASEAAAAAQSKDAAICFAAEHMYCLYDSHSAGDFGATDTIIGFGDLGLIEGSYAVAWQRQYAEYVLKKALFGYFQRLGMKWHWRF